MLSKSLGRNKCSLFLYIPIGIAFWLVQTSGGNICEIELLQQLPVVNVDIWITYQPHGSPVLEFKVPALGQFQDRYLYLLCDSYCTAVGHNLSEISL